MTACFCFRTTFFSKKKKILVLVLIFFLNFPLINKSYRLGRSEKYYLSLYFFFKNTLIFMPHAVLLYASKTIFECPEGEDLSFLFTSSVVHTISKLLFYGFCGANRVLVYFVLYLLNPADFFFFSCSFLKLASFSLCLFSVDLRDLFSSL